MKHSFFTLIVFIGFVILFSSCQTQKKQDENEIETIQENSDDIEMMESTETIREQKPIDKDYFKRFDKIELAYYPHSVRSHGAMMTCSKLIKNGVFEVDSLQKKVVLTQSQLQEVEQVAFTEPTQEKWQAADCFFPRHSLIFYEKEKATCIIEICFECSNICYSPYEGYDGMNLEFKFEEMKKLFDKILKS